MSTDSSSKCDSTCGKPAKWSLVLDDRVLPMPRQIVLAAVIRDQGGVPAEFAIVRDHNSPNDVVVDDHQEVDLAKGNVFYTLKRCEIQERGECREEAKLAFVINDKAEVTTRGSQTGKMLRDLFALPSHSGLFRDLDGPGDDEIGLETHADFKDGPVFYTRHAEATLEITVNRQVFTEHQGVTATMTGVQVAALVFPENPRETTVKILSEGGKELGLDETVHIHNCEEFEVCRKQVTGGFETSRIERELSILRAGGQRVTLIDQPVPAVIYHDVSVAKGEVVSATDVLVVVPNGYAASFIDGVYLPEGSPLMTRVKGEPQDPRINALGQKWRLISYHPHQGGGAPAWNPVVHGYHTYFGEVLSWLSNLR